MTLFFSLVVSFVGLRLASSVLTPPLKGYSFEKQADAVLPPPVSFPHSTPQNGNPYQVLVGISGDAGIQNGPAAAASTTITAPQFVWGDTTGVVYFTDAKNHLIRAVDTSNNVITIAGTGSEGFNGDGSAATSTSLSRPRGISGAGDRLIVCDLGNKRVRVIALGTAKTVSTIAGTGVQGYSGEGVAATSAELWSPYGVWIDESKSQGDIYFTELHQCTIRKISGADGTITTVAGVPGTCDSNGDSNPATSTFLNLPRAIFGTKTGVIYFTEFGSNLARKLDGTTIVTIAGTGSAQALIDQGDGQPALQASLSGPTGIWVDKNDNVYIAESYGSVVRKIDASGKITTEIGVQGARGPFLKVGVQNILFHPRGVWGDERATLKLYLPDSDNHRIVTMALPLNTITTFAGKGIITVSFGGGPAPNYAIGVPRGVWGDTSGNVFFTEHTSNVIYKVNPANILSVFAGRSGSVIDPDGTPASSANFRQPTGIWGDTNGLYIGERGYRVFRMIAWSDNNPVSVLAGGGSTVLNINNIAATSVRFTSPSGIIGDGNGVYYLTDNGIGGSLFQYSSDTKTVTKLTASNSYSFSSVKAAVLDGLGNLIFSENRRIVKFDLSTRVATTIIGTSAGGNSADGVTADANAAINTPEGLWLDSQQNLYFAENSANKIRVIYKDTNTLGTLAGSGAAGSSFDNNDATIAQLNNPTAIFVDSNNNFYIADTFNYKIRVIKNFKVPVSSSSRRLLAQMDASIQVNSSHPLISPVKSKTSHLRATTSK